MVDKQKVYGIDTVELTSQLWVLVQRYRTFKNWPEGFEATNHYELKLSLKSKDSFLTEDKEYTGKDAVRLLRPEYLDSMAKHIGENYNRQMKIYSDFLHGVVDWKNNNGSTTQNS